MTFEEQLKSEVNPNIKKIGEHLLAMAQSDVSLKKKLRNENKSLSDCFKCIIEKAKKKAKNGCACIADDEVYGWAVHYYDEENIIVSKAEKTEAAIVEEPKPVAVKKKKNDPVEGQISLF